MSTGHTQVKTQYGLPHILILCVPMVENKDYNLYNLSSEVWQHKKTGGKIGNETSTWSSCFTNEY